MSVLRILFLFWIKGIACVSLSLSTISHNAIDDTLSAFFLSFSYRTYKKATVHIAFV